MDLSQIIQGAEIGLNMFKSVLGATTLEKIEKLGLVGKQVEVITSSGSSHLKGELLGIAQNEKDEVCIALKVGYIENEEKESTTADIRYIPAYQVSMICEPCEDDIEIPPHLFVRKHPFEGKTLEVVTDSRTYTGKFVQSPFGMLQIEQEGKPVYIAGNYSVTILD